MGGRRPASPQIVPSQPPAGMIGGGPSIFGRLIRSAGRGKKKFKSGRRRRGGEPQRPSTMNFPRNPTPDQQQFIDRFCPDPNMHILMANGSQKRAGDLKVGDLIKTYHEKDLEKTGKKF